MEKDDMKTLLSIIPDDKNHITLRGLIELHLHDGLPKHIITSHQSYKDFLASNEKVIRNAIMDNFAHSSDQRDIELTHHNHYLSAAFESLKDKSDNSKKNEYVLIKLALAS